MSQKVVLNTGGEEYSFYDEFDRHMFDIIIIPSDLGMAKRCDEVIDFFNKMPEPKGQEDIEPIEEELKKKLDYLLGAEMSEGIFRNITPLSPIKSGVLFFEEVIEKICGLIEKEIGVRTKKLEKRKLKYTAKYHK